MLFIHVDAGEITQPTVPSPLGLMNWHFAIVGVGGVIIIVAPPTIICISVLLIRHKRGRYMC